MEYLYVHRRPMDTLNFWIEKGYEHFGLFGPEKLSIKRIAEDNAVSRTTFHYYFKSQEEFIDELLRYHCDLHKVFCEYGKANCKNYIPDLHEMIVHFSLGFKFHKQLFNHQNIQKYREVFQNCNKISGREFVVQMFINHYNLPLTFEDACSLHESLTETWYSRLDLENMELSHLIRLTDEIMEPLLHLIKNIQIKTRKEIISLPLELI
ncbi:TetR/AcrR family transcriptional regulator [Namhaeicola litoreus]|uniref:TetR/AcrR family transcriptional regulator n=1 Tax=Namhaeicola litoreus TaxID=1052145 RepID=A0ABW3XY34_9FLAO